jgi:hypothetical protein
VFVDFDSNIGLVGKFMYLFFEKVFVIIYVIFLKVFVTYKTLVLCTQKLFSHAIDDIYVVAYEFQKFWE